MKSKIILLFLMLLVTTMSVDAQDIITKTDGSSVTVRVIEITTTSVKYKKMNNPDGPLYTIPIGDVQSITYENGVVEKYNSQSAPTPAPSVASTPASHSYQSAYDYQNQAVNDYRLLAIDSDDMDLEKYASRAKTYRWVGGIGGAVFVGTGLCLLLIDTELAFATCTGAGLIGVGVVGCTSFFIAAHHQAKKAREIRSLAITETSIFNNGKQKLTAGIDMLNDRYMPAIGMGLRLSF